MNTSTRTVIGIAVPLLPLVAVATAFAVWWGDLPDPVASHWGLDGAPDDSFARTPFAAVMIALVVASGVAAHLISRRPDPVHGSMSAPLGLVTFLQWAFGGVALSAVVANVDAATWQEASDLPIAVVLAVVALAIAVAAAVGAAARSIERRVTSPAHTLPSVGLATGERATWMGTVTTRWPLVLGGAFALVGLTVLITVDVIIGVVLIVASLPILSFTSVQVVVDRRGLTVRYGPLGWPRNTIALDRIAEASTVDVTGATHGGWGYRGSLKVLGKASLVLRAGEGVRVDLRDGKRFVVTVDGASDAAGTLNDLAGVTGTR